MSKPLLVPRLTSAASPARAGRPGPGVAHEHALASPLPFHPIGDWSASPVCSSFRTQPLSVRTCAPPPPPSCHLCVSLGLCLDPFRPPEKPRLHLLSPWQGRRCCCWHQSARDSPPMSLPVPRAFRPIRELRAPCFLSERTLCLALPCSLRSSFSSSNPLGSLPL